MSTFTSHPKCTQHGKSTNLDILMQWKYIDVGTRSALVRMEEGGGQRGSRREMGTQEVPLVGRRCLGRWYFTSKGTTKQHIQYSPGGFFTTSATWEAHSWV